jgi:hypothetical protein
LQQWQKRITPNVAKARGLQSQGAKGAAVVNLLQAFGNAGSGALWLSALFLGKKDGIKSVRSSSSPLVYSSQNALTQCDFNTLNLFLTFCHLFYATLGLPMIYCEQRPSSKHVTA